MSVVLGSPVRSRGRMPGVDHDGMTHSIGMNGADVKRRRLGEQQHQPDAGSSGEYSVGHRQPHMRKPMEAFARPP